MKLLKKILFLFFLLLLGFALFAIGYYYAVTKDVRLNPQKLLVNEKTVVVYDERGEVVPSSMLCKQTTAIGDIPSRVKQAFIDVEDKRFYRHNGYDIKGIARAAINNVKARSFAQGASTVSQQLIKNTHLSQEKTLKRKLREFKLTKALEKRYSKEEILEKYLNTIYFGHGCFGIASASEFYFQKTPDKLELAEGALLAGLVKSPNNYSPFKNPERCQKRKEIVLRVMEENGSITPAQRLDAVHSPLPQSPTKKERSGYMQFVFDELTAIAERHAFKVGGKVEIFTYLDQETQKITENIIAAYTESDKIALVLDEKTGGFKACVSTVGNIRRLPGSLIKPLLVYAPALEEDVLSPATPILDAKINYNGYAPENYDGQYHGYVSARECVEKSLNIPAVKVLESLTVKKGARYLEKLGLPVDKEDESLALALGGMRRGFTLRDMVTAYSALQNGGLYRESGFISAVKINGVSVYRRAQKSERVFSEESAQLTTDILKGTAERGTAKKLRSLPFEIAAKTGTVGTAKGNTDAYALSYTTKDCIAVWLGNADNTPVACTGGGEPCNLLYALNLAIGRAYEEKNVKIPAFSVGKNVVRVDLDKATYYDTHTLSLADELSPPSERISELFKKSAIPLNKSVSFSKPSIPPPRLSVQNNAVVITFDERCPTHYGYKIDRYDYVTHTTVYEGAFIPSFIDESLEEGKTYVYTVTPYYKEKAGQEITLPSVNRKSNFADQEILSKDWWDY